MATYESMKVGDHEFSFPSFPLKVLKYDYAYGDLDLTIPVDAGLIIVGVGHEVRTAFAGGTEAIAIGDGTTTDFWLTSALLGPTTEAFVHNIGSSAAGGVGARISSTAAGKVVLTASTELTAGEGSVYLFVLDVSENWRTSGRF